MPGPRVGPYASLPGHVVRSGESGTVMNDGRTWGHVTQVEYTTAVAQIPVRMAGSYREETKPGIETRTGTFGFHDVDDGFTLRVWRFLEARRAGDRSAAVFPEFSIVVKLDDIGAPDESRWQLDGVQLFQLDGGYNTANDLEGRTTPFTYRSETPVHAYEYGDGGLIVTEEPGA